MSGILPVEVKRRALFNGDKWEALSQAMQMFHDVDISPLQFQLADAKARDESAWWEEFVYAPYCVEDGDVYTVGGWLIVMPTQIENVWEISYA